MSKVPKLEDIFHETEAEATALIFRWRLVVALLSIRWHTEQIQERLSTSVQFTENQDDAQDGRKDLEQTRDSQSYAKTSEHRATVCISSYVRNMRSQWTRTSFALPNDWIPAADTNMYFAPGENLDDFVYQMIRQLTKFYLYPIREHCLPIGHGSVPVGILPEGFTHLPRAIGTYRRKLLQDDKERFLGECYLYKLHDILSMIASDWRHLNLYVAHTFSGFSGYGIRWNTASYYFADWRERVFIWGQEQQSPSDSPEARDKQLQEELPDSNHDVGAGHLEEDSLSGGPRDSSPPHTSEVTVMHGSRIVVDFALAPQHKPATTQRSIARAQVMPLTNLSPAIFLGARVLAPDNDGSYVQSHELEALRRLAIPHLQALHMASHALFSSSGAEDTEYAQQSEQGPTTSPTEDDSPDKTLFCTLVKPGFIHVITMNLVQRYQEPDQVEANVLDSFPVSLVAQTPDHTLDRLRLVMALFTLLAHVIKFSDYWNGLPWPSNIVNHDSGTVQHVTQMYSPSASETLSQAKERVRWPARSEESYFSDCTVEAGDDWEHALDAFWYKRKFTIKRILWSKNPRPRSRREAEITLNGIALVEGWVKHGVRDGFRATEILERNGLN